MPSVTRDNRRTLLRWNDYLTGRTCTLRIAYSDAKSPLSELTAKYLTDADPNRLLADGMILPESVETLLVIQELSHGITDQGASTFCEENHNLGGLSLQLSPGEFPPSAPAMVRDTEVDLIDLTIDRSETGYSRNWTGFNRRRWERSAPELESLVEASVRGMAGNNSDEVLSLKDHKSRATFLKRIAKTIWDSPFENYSRFTGHQLRYKTGDESLMSIIEGHGAICSEKVQALKFLTDRYGFESHYVLAGPDAPGRLPTDRLRNVLDTFDFRGAAPAMRYWQHMALEVVVDDERILVDATNGNIPFMFIRGPEAELILDSERPRPIKVKMGTYPEDFYYHRSPDDLALDLCYAMENFIPEIDLVQVFDNELGLVITPEFLIAPLPYSSEAGFDALSELYRGLADPRGLAFDIHSEWRLDGPVGTLLCENEPTAASLVLDSHEYLLDRFNRFEDDWHEMGLAAIQLIPDR